MNYYKHHIGDYRRDTAHLSLLEHGVYRQLLDTYYLSEQPIPSETEQVIRRLSARTEQERDAVLLVLAEFFSLVDGAWKHARCDSEIESYHKRADSSAANGKHGGRPPKKPTKTNPVISRVPNRKATTNHEPLTNNQVESNIPGVSAELLADYVEVRKGKRAGKLTATVIAGLQREADKAGITLADAVKACCEYGWQGFNADWYAQRQCKAGGADPYGLKGAI